ncbi:MAG: hypothetical protein M3122_03250 [Actinomycetota bacterium]|nr:hypothetical protein [Actinomycetota bacterium]
MTVTFQLTVEGEPPEYATFFGYLGYEPAPSSFDLVEGEGGPGAGLPAAWPTVCEALFRPANGATTMVLDVAPCWSAVYGLHICGRTR